MIERTIKLSDYIKPAETLVLYGARRTGKTTLIDQYITQNQSKKKIIKYNGDNLSVINDFSINELDYLKKLVEGYDTLVIDEAQNIPNIGRSLKIMNDELKNLEIIVSGSSSFELQGQIGEPLVGRKTTLQLFPLSSKEILDSYNLPKTIAWQKLRDQLLIYGSFPNSVIADSDDERKNFLAEYVNSLLLKDILTFQDVKGSDYILKLLRCLAFQVGDEVSVEELGNSIGISKNTVNRYLELLEKAFIIFRLDGYSKNLRNEMTKKSKYYFYDVGIRNAIINNFNSPDLRDDMGAIWENYAIVEMIKKLKYNGSHANLYFWRTYQGDEIDLLVEADGAIKAYEMKWSDKKHPSLPGRWIDEYGEIEYDVINRENYDSYL